MTDRTMNSEFSRCEWQVVMLGFQDAATCGCDDPAASWRSRIRELLTGRKRPNPLGNDRLEALRKFACTTSRERRLAEESVPALLKHGFNRRQVSAVASLSA